MAFDIIPNWQLLAFAAALTNVFYGIILQKYGDFTSSPQTMAKGTEEIKKGIQTVFIVSFLVLFITAIFEGFGQVPMPGWLVGVQLFGSAFYPEGLGLMASGCNVTGDIPNLTYYCNPIEHARVWVSVQRNVLNSIYSTLLVITSVLEPFNTMEIELGFDFIVKGDVTTAPFKGLLGGPLNAIYERMNEIANIIALLNFQEGLLDIAEYAMAVFFPIGIILRSFPPTRLVGAFLMSLGIVLYLVFPLSFYLLDLTMEGPFEELNGLSTALLTAETLTTWMTGGFNHLINFSAVPPSLDITGMLDANANVSATMRGTVFTLAEIVNLFIFTSETFPLFSLLLCAICLFSFTKALS